MFRLRRKMQVNAIGATGTLRHGRNSSAAAFCAFAIILTALPAGAQGRSRTDEADRVSEKLLSAVSKQQVGEYNAARDILLEALSKTPDSASLLDALGSVQQDLGEYLEAERSYLRALSASEVTQRDRERIAVLYNLATLYLDTGQYSKGERIREQLENLRPGALDHQPAEAGALLNLMACLEHARKRDDKAERYYSRSLASVRQAHGP
jgi:tetratricopeptide (TPR) repeat protein